MTEAERYCTVYSGRGTAQRLSRPKNWRPISNEVKERREFIRNHNFIINVGEDGNPVYRIEKK